MNPTLELKLEEQNGFWHLLVNGKRVSTRLNREAIAQEAKTIGARMMKELLEQEGLEIVPGSATPRQPIPETNLHGQTLKLRKKRK